MNEQRMDIYSKPGDKVVFKYPSSGYEFEVALTKERLVEGQEYEISTIAVGDWKTRITLVGVEGSFNSIQFAPGENNE